MINTTYIDIFISTYFACKKITANVISLHKRIFITWAHMISLILAVIILWVILPDFAFLESQPFCWKS